uniref:AlNc14C19G2034 protein n=1 Tax=Albugo laibachii Nc14 TaxID=890382 RepID=F0W563_9STRA|nr:AlNc14C19G2034 [Albugo laibachii Nc14]|eukprot:CCA16254.1 AlNc14C19G2034 [Albugo laibachii Nc14]
MAAKSSSIDVFQEQFRLLCNGDTEARNYVLCELSYLSIRLEQDSTNILAALASQLSDLFHFLLKDLLLAADRFVSFAAKEILLDMISNIPVTDLSCENCMSTLSIKNSSEFKLLGVHNALDCGMRQVLVCRSFESRIACMMLLRDLLNSDTRNMVLGSVLEVLRLHIVDKRIAWKESILSNLHHTILLLELLTDSIFILMKIEVEDLKVYDGVEQIGMEAMNVLCNLEFGRNVSMLLSSSFRFLVQLQDYLSFTQSIYEKKDTVSRMQFRARVALFLHSIVDRQIFDSLCFRQNDNSLSMVRPPFVSSESGCTLPAQWIHLFCSVKLSSLQTNDMQSHSLLKQVQQYFPTHDQLIQNLVDQDDLLIAVLDILLQIYVLPSSKCGWKEDEKFLNECNPDLLFGHLLKLFNFDALVIVDLLTSQGTHHV